MCTVFCYPIDDHSKKMWAFLVKTKDQALDIVRKFLVKAERKISRKLKSLRSDNSSEYRGPFEEYCEKHDIRLEKTL